MDARLRNCEKGDRCARTKVQLHLMTLEVARGSGRRRPRHNRGKMQLTTPKAGSQAGRRERQNAGSKGFAARLRSQEARSLVARLSGLRSVRL